MDNIKIPYSSKNSRKQFVRFQENADNRIDKEQFEFYVVRIFVACTVGETKIYK